MNRKNGSSHKITNQQARHLFSSIEAKSKHPVLNLPINKMLFIFIFSLSATLTFIKVTTFKHSKLICPFNSPLLQ